MEKTGLMFFAIALGMAFFTWQVIWSRRRTLHRPIAVAAFVVWVPTLGGIALQSLGWHKPMWAAIELQDRTDLRVMAHKLVRGEAIYLYVDTGEGEPRAYKLEWSDEVAQQLQDAVRGSRGNGNQGGAIMEFDHSWDQHPPQFHPLPRPRLPIPKGEPDEPERYERA